MLIMDLYFNKLILWVGGWVGFYVKFNFCILFSELTNHILVIEICIKYLIVIRSREFIALL